jgi:hypothetical protein
MMHCIQKPTQPAGTVKRGRDNGNVQSIRFILLYHLVVSKCEVYGIFALAYHEIQYQVSCQTIFIQPLHWTAISPSDLKPFA